jgi:uncharacterized MAPEG superfamily protein
MPDFLVPYASTLAAFVCLGGLFLVQVLVSDVVAIRAGHVPGTPIAGGHDDLVFRATRALANTNENLAIFILLSMSAVLLGGSATWTNRFAWTFVLARAGHMLAYYADQRTLRSAIFTLGVVALVGLLVVSIAALGA